MNLGQSTDIQRYKHENIEWDLENDIEGKLRYYRLL